MRLKVFILLILNLFSFSSRALSMAGSSFSIDYFLMSPLKIGEETFISIKTVTTSKEGIPFKVYIENEKYPDGQEIVNASLKNGIYSFKYNNYYTCIGENTIWFTYVSKSMLFKQRHIAYVAESKRVSLEDDNVVKSSSNILVYTKMNGWRIINEQFEFSGFDDLYIPDYYHKLDLSDFSFTRDILYDSDFAFDATLIVSNVDGVFNDIGGPTSLVSIPLKAVKDDKNKFHLEPSINLYVDSKTLKMSDKNKEGYIKTKHLYFPINKMNEQDKYDLLIKINKLGFNYYSLTHQFSLNALINNIGDCHNSEYCIMEKSLWLIAFFMHYFLHYSYQLL